MLEHLGAYTIDADALSHRAIARGAPGYEPVLLTFGRWILDGGGEVDRAKLGNLVFHDPAALTQLEAIIHPLVRQAIEILMQRTPRSVVVIEAIKLLEGELKGWCDGIWVTYAPRALQIERLTAQRGLSHDEALRRVDAQGPQTDKIAAADVVIRNTTSMGDLWKQVVQAWEAHVPVVEQPQPPAAEETRTGVFTVSRGKPRDAARIAELINRLGKDPRTLTPDDIMSDFGEKAYMLLHLNGALVGVAGWQVENLVVRITDVHLQPGIRTQEALQHLIREIELVSGDLQCEASLIFPDGQLAKDQTLWTHLGYENRLPDSLGIQAWTEAAKESMPLESELFFKQLRHDRILRPI
jgi:dephospho-CoA kinase